MAKSTSARPKPRWWQRQWDKLLFLVVLAVFFLLSPGQNIYTLSLDGALRQVRRLPFAVPSPAPYPVNVTGVYLGTDMSAAAIAVYDMDSGVYLFTRNEKELLSPASTTKILTALVALDFYELDDILSVKTVVNDGQDMGLVTGERMTVENLLFGTLVQSANDAAYTLADNYPGGLSNFVKAMNEKAKQLDLADSNFTNPNGFDDPNHKVTALDLVKLARVALTNTTIAKMVAIPQITVSDVTHRYFHPLTNVNELLGKIPGVGGIKTGWTEEAGENLITLLERDGHRIIAVVLKSSDRFGDTTRLINWIFENYQWQAVAKSQ